ncbi:MAG: MaoC family dehydratase [Desulfobacterales bacterium]|nr:MaoC family dehydratase [Desulfobacterales bacterium]
MTTQKTPEEFLQESKKMIGKETETTAAPYPVEYEPIRRYCMMVDDTNPLFQDPDYAKKTQYGDVILPPFAPFGIMAGNFISAITKALPPLPGPYVINMAQEWEWMKPIKVGDRLSTKTRLSDVHIKKIRIDPKAFWIVFETEVSNQNGDVVCIYKNILLNHRPPNIVAQEQQSEKGD